MRGSGRGRRWEERRERGSNKTGGLRWNGGKGRGQKKKHVF